jgi:hypothetical protein
MRSSRSGTWAESLSRTRATWTEPVKDVSPSSCVLGSHSSSPEGSPDPSELGFPQEGPVKVPSARPAQVIVDLGLDPKQLDGLTREPGAIGPMVHLLRLAVRDVRPGDTAPMHPPHVLER